MKQREIIDDENYIIQHSGYVNYPLKEVMYKDPTYLLVTQDGIIDGKRISSRLMYQIEVNIKNQLYEAEGTIMSYALMSYH